MLKSRVPSNLSSWLHYPGSLTERLSKKFPGEIEIVVHAHALGRPTISEAESLGQSPNQDALVREITIQHDEAGVATPLVYARSIIPVTTLIGENKILLNLGNRSLGDYLFQDATLQRSPPEIIRLQQDNPLYQRVIKNEAEKPEALWGRYSIFKLRGLPLRVAEYFLPGCLVEYES